MCAQSLRVGIACRTALVVLLVGLWGNPAAGQLANADQSLRDLRAGDLRYELGRRTQIVERAWIACSDVDHRQAAIPFVQRAVAGFFSSRPDQVAQSLAAATAELNGEPRTPAAEWTDALQVSVTPQLVSTGPARLKIRADWLYKPQVECPSLALVVTRDQPGQSDELLRRSVQEIPFESDCELAPAGAERDAPIWITVSESAGQTVAQWSIGLSRAQDLKRRLSELQQELAPLPADSPSIELTTARYLTNLLQQLADGKTLETDYPAAKLLQQAEELAALATQRASLPKSRVGEYYLAVGGGDSAVPVRVLVCNPDARVVVVAVHGAGGSENMFFDAYGDGLIVDLCRKRGWTLIAPTYRSPLDDVWNTVERVEGVAAPNASHRFLVGHSLGAVTVLRMGQAHPDRLSGLAAISGGAVGDLTPLSPGPFVRGGGHARFRQGGRFECRPKSAGASSAARA
jgi:hypothetical protein